MQTKKFTVMDVIFIVALLVITAAMVFIFINIINNSKKITFDSIEEIKYEDVLKQNTNKYSTYFVYFYNSSDRASRDKHELIATDLVNAYKTIKLDNVKTNIYKIDVAKSENSGYTSTISNGKTPALIIVDAENNTVHIHQTVTDVTKIISTLNDEIAELKK